jgi:hypothetical protein
MEAVDRLFQIGLLVIDRNDDLDRDGVRLSEIFEGESVAGGHGARVSRKPWPALGVALEFAPIGA